MNSRFNENNNDTENSILTISNLYKQDIDSASLEDLERILEQPAIPIIFIKKINIRMEALMNDLGLTQDQKRRLTLLEEYMNKIKRLRKVNDLGVRESNLQISISKELKQKIASDSRSIFEISDIIMCIMRWIPLSEHVNYKLVSKKFHYVIDRMIIEDEIILTDEYVFNTHGLCKNESGLTLNSLRNNEIIIDLLNQKQVHTEYVVNDARDELPACLGKHIGITFSCGFMMVALISVASLLCIYNQESFKLSRSDKMNISIAIGSSALALLVLIFVVMLTLRELYLCKLKKTAGEGYIQSLKIFGQANLLGPVSEVNSDEELESRQKNKAEAELPDEDTRLLGSAYK